MCRFKFELYIVLPYNFVIGKEEIWIEAVQNPSFTEILHMPEKSFVFMSRNEEKKRNEKSDLYFSSLKRVIGT